jgi:hypothetical protein
MSEFKSIKLNARAQVRGHYILLVVACAISIFIGTEFSGLVSDAQRWYDVLTGQVTQLDMDGIREDGEDTTSRILDDLIADNLAAGKEEAARRIGKSQSAVANKLRLLKLPRDVLEGLREHGLSERHGRALLRLNSPDAQRMALMYIADNGLSVAAAEAYIEELLAGDAPAQKTERPEPRRSLILKDVRVFLNSLNHSLAVMKQGGIDAGLRREETEDALILTISIPKEKPPAAT